MAITNKIEELQASHDEVMTSYANLGNPGVAGHIDNIPAPPQTKQVLKDMLTMILWLMGKES